MQTKIRLFAVSACTLTGWTSFGVYLAPSPSYAIAAAEKEHGALPRNVRACLSPCSP